MKVEKIILICCSTLLFFNSALANCIDTEWTVKSHVGETWFADSKTIIGKKQDFHKGWASGIFYSCDFAGQSATYNKYSQSEFYNNKEFQLFGKYRSEIKFDDDIIYVHRISCNGEKGKSQRAVLYPFITTDKGFNAFYLFEGAIYSLAGACGGKQSTTQIKSEVATEIQPSFDCLKASTNIEKLICRNKDLSVLDGLLAHAYKQAQSIEKNLTKKDEVRKQQVDWTKNIRNTCKDANCLNTAYSERIASEYADFEITDSYFNSMGWKKAGYGSGSRICSHNYKKGSFSVSVYVYCAGDGFNTLSIK